MHTTFSQIKIILFISNPYRWHKLGRMYLSLQKTLGVLSTHYNWGYTDSDIFFYFILPFEEYSNIKCSRWTELYENITVFFLNNNSWIQQIHTTGSQGVLWKSTRAELLEKYRSNENWKYLIYWNNSLTTAYKWDFSTYMSTDSLGIDSLTLFHCLY